jgi:hypothetical protein
MRFFAFPYTDTSVASTFCKTVSQKQKTSCTHWQAKEIKKSSVGSKLCTFPKGNYAEPASNCHQPHVCFQGTVDDC